MPYSTVGDLLLGDLVVSVTVDKQKFVDSAEDDINSKLGFRYKVPIDVDATSFPLHQKLLLKTICNRLATGKLILTLDIAEEGTALHAYGLHLLREANADLLLIANGEVDLRGAEPTEGGAGRQTNRQPLVLNRDDRSAVSAFEEMFMGGQPVPTSAEGWRPGSGV